MVLTTHQEEDQSYIKEGGGGTSAAAAISTRNVNRNRIFRTNEVILLLGAAEEVEIMEFIEKKFEVESNSKRTWEL